MVYHIYSEPYYHIYCSEYAEKMGAKRMLDKNFDYSIEQYVSSQIGFARS